MVPILESVPSQWLVSKVEGDSSLHVDSSSEEGSLTAEACSPTLRPNKPRNTHWKCWCAIFMNKSLGYFRCILHLNICVSGGEIMQIFPTEMEEAVSGIHFSLR